MKDRKVKLSILKIMIHFNKINKNIINKNNSQKLKSRINRLILIYRLKITKILNRNKIYLELGIYLINN